MPDPKKNVAYTFDLSLVDSANRPQFKVNPTLATGDFKVSIDEGAFANLATLPTVTPAGGRNVKVALSAAEMNGDRITVQAVDAAGAEWDEVLVALAPAVQILDDTALIIPAGDIGDLDGLLPVDLKFVSTLGSVLTALAGSPAISIYKDNSVTQSTAGITLTTSFDSVVGLNNLNVDPAADGAFYSAGSNFQAVLTAGTVGGVSVVGRVVGSFSIRARAALMPTVAGRTADLTANGNIGVDLGNAENQGATLALSGTTIAVASSVAALGTQAKADVNAETVDVLNVDTYAEPGQATPAATLSIVAKIGYLFKALRNKKEQTGSQFKLYNDGGTVVDQKATVSSDSSMTTTGELGTGP